MKSILVPVDFSARSVNALTYACELNKKLNAGIEIFHSYFIPVPATEIPAALPSDAQIRRESRLELDKLRQNYEQLYPGYIFKTKITEGFPDIEIIDESTKQHPDLLVMGARGTNALKRFLIGSTTAAVIEKSACTVIAVPEDAQFTHINKIVFAANYGTDDYKNVFDLVSFARRFSAEVILLHVSTGDRERAFDFSQVDNFKEKIQHETSYEKISAKLMDYENVYEGLNKYLEEINADLFALSMRNRSFFQKIFQPSLSKKMIYHSHIPVMIYHTHVS